MLDQAIAITEEAVTAGCPERGGIDESDALMPPGYEVSDGIDSAGVNVAADAMVFLIDGFAHKVDDRNTRMDAFGNVGRVNSLAGNSNDQTVNPVALHGEQQFLFALKTFMTLTDEDIVTVVIGKLFETLHRGYIEVVKHAGNQDAEREGLLLLEPDGSLVRDEMKLLGQLLDTFFRDHTDVRMVPQSL